MHRSFLLVLALVGALVAAAPAAGSELVARNATNVSLKVDSAGRAIVYYKIGAKQHRVLFSGAVNARHPQAGAQQVAFRKDYSGGWRTMRQTYWKTIRNTCRRYSGPKLPFFVTGCTERNGTHWALQSWQKMLPNLGVDPWKASQSAHELHVSRWQGELPVLELYASWAWSNRWQQLFGRLTYQGRPVYGFGSTSVGNPTDRWGRNVYLDTFDSTYGAGWKRENSFLTHRPNGNFCYLLSPRDRYAWYPPGDRRGPGTGERYRLSVLGPGVTPIVSVAIASKGDFDRSAEHRAHKQAMDALADQLSAGDESKTPCTQR